MKKMIAIVLTMVLLTMGLGASAVFSAPGDWTIAPDSPETPDVSVVGNTVIMGTANVAEGTSQNTSCHGASMELPPAASYHVTFNYDLNTWDSYNAPGTPNPPYNGGTGYWDSFSVSVSQGMYWNLSLTDPLNGDPLSLGFSWGGTSYGDGFLESNSGTATVIMAGDPLSTNYLNVVLDTATLPDANHSYPSWGEIEIVRIEYIGSIKEPTPFTPDPTGNGRAVAFDGTDLYYTLYPDTNIYKVSTINAPIATLTPGVQFGSLSWDPTRGVLWGGSYDGTTNVYTIDPTTGLATFQFDETAFGGIAQDSAYGPGTENYIDGIAYDATDDTLWLSGDACATIYHVNINGTLISSFPVPNHPSTAAQGYNTGITVAPGGYLEIAMQSGPDQGPHVIAKVTKEDPSTIVYFFVALTTNNPGVEGIAYDPDTYAPRAVVWTNQFGATNALTAFDVQVTRTLGYWKTHSEDAEEFLPITLGDNDEDGVCVTVEDAEDVEDVMRAAKAKDAADMLKAQLLAAKLNLAMGDIPLADVVAIAPIIAAADELLGRNGCDPDTGRMGADRAEATALIYELDMFNNKYSP